MRTYPDCIPCFVRQSLEAARLVHPEDEEFQLGVLRRVLQAAAAMDYRLPPPTMGRDIHRLLRSLSGVDDLYHESRRRSNDFALALLPELRELVRRSADPFATAVRLAVAGNVIDFGITIDLSEDQIHRTIDQALAWPLDPLRVNAFREALRRAKGVLYAGDNSGEIVFDRLLIETIRQELGEIDLTFAVRGMPILNDVTLEDARQVGMDRVASRVIANGGDAPGTLVEDCSPEFLERLGSCELVISKGQGNYETLSEVDQEVWFLLKAKCGVIARDLGVPLGELVLVRKARS